MKPFRYNNNQFEVVKKTSLEDSAYSNRRLYSSPYATYSGSVEDERQEADDEGNMFKVDTKLYSKEEIEALTIVTKSQHESSYPPLSPPPSPPSQPQEEQLVEGIIRNNYNNKEFAESSSSWYHGQTYNEPDSGCYHVRTSSSSRTSSNQKKLRIPLHVKRLCASNSIHNNNRQQRSYQMNNNYETESHHKGHDEDRCDSVDNHHSNWPRRYRTNTFEKQATPPPIKLLDESKRIALKAFCDTVKRMKSTLKQPLHVYLKENQGKGFIGITNSISSNNSNLSVRGDSSQDRERFMYSNNMMFHHRDMRDDRSWSMTTPSMGRSLLYSNNNYRPTASIERDYYHYHGDENMQEEDEEEMMHNQSYYQRFVDSRRVSSPPLPDLSPVLEDDSPTLDFGNNHNSTGAGWKTQTRGGWNY